MRWERVLSGPVIEQFTVNVACRRAAGVAEVQIVVVMSVAATSHGFNVDEGWSTARHGVLPGNGGGSVPSRRV